MDHCKNGHREGGTGLMFQDSFHVKKAGGGKHESFKFWGWIVSSLSDKFCAVIIYHPPYSEGHHVTSITFCTEIAGYFEYILLTKEKLAIMRDI